MKIAASLKIKIKVELCAIRILFNVLKVNYKDAFFPYEEILLANIIVNKYPKPQGRDGVALPHLC